MWRDQKCVNCKQNYAADAKEYEMCKKRILEIKHTKNISYSEARKLVKYSVATTYGNIAKPMNNLIQNQEMTPTLYGEVKQQIREARPLKKSSITTIYASTIKSILKYVSCKRPNPHQSS